MRVGADRRHARSPFGHRGHGARSRPNEPAKARGRGVHSGNVSLAFLLTVATEIMRERRIELQEKTGPVGDAEAIERPLDREAHRPGLFLTQGRLGATLSRA